MTNPVMALRWCQSFPRRGDRNTAAIHRGWIANDTPKVSSNLRFRIQVKLLKEFRR